MSRRQTILKDAGIYTFCSYGAQALDMVTGILIRRFLGPTQMGVWAFLQVIQNYAKHAGLGVTTATARDVPYYLEKGDKAKAEEIQNMVFTFTMATAALVSVGVIGYALLKRGSYDTNLWIGLFVVAALIVLQRSYNLLVVLLRAYKEFTFAGVLNFVSSSCNLLLTILLVYKWKLYGFFATLILNYIFLICFILKRTPYRFRFTFNLKAFTPLLGLGSAMLISDILRTVLVSIDRIMITRFLGFEALGLYSVALMAGNYLYSLPNMLGIIFFPHLQETFAKRDRKEDLEKFLREPTLAIAYLFPMLIAGVSIFSTWIVPLLLPKYVSGIPALQLFVLSSFFMALTHTFANFIITVRKHWQLIPLQTVSVGLGFFVTWLALHRGWGIQGVAFASIVIAASHFFILSWVSFREVYSFKKRIELYGKVFGSFLILILGLKLSDFLFPLTQGFLQCLFHYGCFVLFASPLLWFAEKETKVFTTLKKTLTKQKT